MRIRPPSVSVRPRTANENEKFLEEIARAATDGQEVILGVLVYRPPDNKVLLYHAPAVPVDEVLALAGWERDE